MKKLAVTIVTATMFLTAYALAQTSPQQTPNEELEVALQLLNERTTQVIKLAAEVQKLNKQLQEARAELAKAKTPPPAKP